MSNQQNTICQQLNSLFETFQSTYEESNIRFNLDQYIKDPKSNILSQLNESFSSISSKKQELIEHYQEQAKLILSKWFPFKDDKEALKDFIDSISFDESDQRVIINGNLNLRGSNISYFPELIKTISGDVDLIRTQLTSLDALEEVGGGLNLSDVSSLTSMKSLREVGGYALLQNTQLTSLDALEEVGGALDLRDVSSLTSMSRLRKVGQRISLFRISIDNFSNVFPILQEVGDFDNISFLVSSNKLKKQIEKLKEQRILKYSGEVKVISF